MKIPFDTHAFVKKLTAAGVSEAQAEVHAEALGELVIERLATREDIAALKNDIAALKSDITGVKDEIAALKGELHQLRQEQQAFVTREELRADLKDLELRLTLRFGAMLAAAVAIMVALIKLL